MPPPAQHRNNDLTDVLLDQASHLGLEDYLLRRPLVLGVSGGADSLAMLHLLCALRGESAMATLHVAHLNHWFRAKEGQEDADFVRQIAEAWAIPFTIETVDVPNFARRNKLSPEDAARRVRYGFLVSLAREKGAAVAVAHNADDQVETVLMSILRGTGMAGLAGMQMLSNAPPSSRTEGDSLSQRDASSEPVALFRPLLYVWRHSIIAYCKQHGLEPRFDSTNWERTYRRNRVRHDLIPLLQMQYSLAIKDHLFNLADIANAENSLLDSIIESEWMRVAQVKLAGGEVYFDTHDFALLARALRRRLVRKAIETVAGTLQDISFEHVEVSTAILSAEEGSPVARHLPHGLEVVQEGDRGRVALRQSDSRVPSSQQWTDSAWPLVAPGCTVYVVPEEVVSLGGGWLFYASLSLAPGQAPTPNELIALFDADLLSSPLELIIRARRNGDIIHPIGMEGHKSLQDLMVDAKIPRGLRDHTAVVARGDTGEVIWVPGAGGRRSQYAPVSASTKHLLVLCFERPGGTNGQAAETSRPGER